MSWLESFSDRDQKEIEFARLYATQFHHGTDGHNRLLIIAALRNLIDGYDRNNGDLLKEIQSNKLDRDLIVGLLKADLERTTSEKDAEIARLNAEMEERLKSQSAQANKNAIYVENELGAIIENQKTEIAALKAEIERNKKAYEYFNLNRPSTKVAWDKDRFSDKADKDFNLGVGE